MASRYNGSQTGRSGGSHMYQNGSAVEISFTAADSLVGNKVVDTQGKPLGEIDAIMLDVPNGRIAYVVLSFGGFLGMGVKRFAIPWGALIQDAANEIFVLERRQSAVKNVLVLEKPHWSGVAAVQWATRTHRQHQLPRKRTHLHGIQSCSK